MFGYLYQNCTGYTDESVEMNEHNKKCGHYRQIEAGGSAEDCEEMAAELEANVGGDE